MKILNKEVLSIAKICIVVNNIESRDMSKYSNPLIKAGVKLTEILFVGLFDSPMKSISVGELRKGVSELEELLKCTGVNVVVDASYKRDKDSFVRGLIFKDIFHRDNNLWKERGVLEASLGDYKGKFICGIRAEAIFREKDSRELIDSEFILKPNKVEIVIPKTPDEAKQCFNELAKANYIAFDTEASGLKPFAKDFLLYTLQFTSNKEKDKSYIFFYEHPKKPMSQDFKDVVAKGTKWLIENEKKQIWVHNFSYDGMVCKSKFGIDFYKVNIYDTMIIYHFLTNTYKAVPLGLKDICFTNGIFFDWDNDLDRFKDEICKEMKIKKDDFKYEYFELDDLIQYGAYDTVALMYLVDRLYEMCEQHIAFKDRGLHIINHTWEVNWKPIMQTLYEVMYNGLPLNLELAYKQKKEGEDRIREIDELISENPYIKNTERILSENAMKKALAEFGKKVKEAEEKGKTFKGKVPSYENDKYGSIELKPKFKSTSTDHKKILFIDVLKMKVLEKTDTGNPKLSDDIIQKYAEERPDIDILKLFSEKAKLIKSLSTYVDTWIDLVENDKDGRLRSTFNPLNISGRLRGSNPNLLNITKDGGLKDLIESDYKNGFVIGQIDVNSLEERASLLQHQDPVKLDMKGTGVEDMHSVSAISISKAKKDGNLEHLDATNPEHLKIVKKEFPDLRQAGKALTFGIQFLCSYRSIMFTYGVGEDIARNILDNYWETFKGERAFLNKKIETFVEKGYDVMFGDIPIITDGITYNIEDNENMAKIRPCYNAVSGQSSAFVVLRALDKTTRYFKEKGINFKPLLSVYDSIIWESHIDDFNEIANTLYDNMSIPFLENQLFNLAHEVEIGKSYKAEMVVSRDREEQKKQILEFKEKLNIN